MIIEKPTASDSGIYQCAVHIIPHFYESSTHPTTPWIFLSRKASLNFINIQNFLVQPINQKIFQHQHIAFKCALVNLFFLIYYFRIQIYPSQLNGIKMEREYLKRVFNDSFFKFLDENILLPISNTLEIENAVKEHSGEYNCVANYGNRTLTSNLATLEILEGIFFILRRNFLAYEF